MKPIEFRVQMNKGDIKRGFVLSAAANRPKWVAWVWFGPLVIIAILAGGTLNITFTTIFFTYLALVLLVDAVNKAVQQSVLNKIWSENEAWHTTFHVSLSETGIATETVYGKSIGSWDGYNMVIENEDYFVFFQKNATFLVVPKRELKEGISAEVSDLLRHIVPDKLH